MQGARKRIDPRRIPPPRLPQHTFPARAPLARRGEAPRRTARLFRAPARGARRGVLARAPGRGGPRRFPSWPDARPFYEPGRRPRFRGRGSEDGGVPRQGGGNAAPGVEDRDSEFQSVSHVRQKNRQCVEAPPFYRPRTWLSARPLAGRPPRSPMWLSAMLVALLCIASRRVAFECLALSFLASPVSDSRGPQTEVIREHAPR